MLQSDMLLMPFELCNTVYVFPTSVSNDTVSQKEYASPHHPHQTQPQEKYK